LGPQANSAALEQVCEQAGGASFSLAVGFQVVTVLRGQGLHPFHEDLDKEGCKVHHILAGQTEQGRNLEMLSHLE